MSPLSLRRYRAERLLRSEFGALRGTVLGAVRARLRGGGLTMDEVDLEACYSQAWQGLYTAMLGGEEIRNPAGWLVLVTHRRAIDEHRTRRVEAQLTDRTPAADRDFAEEIDDRRRLSELLQGLGVSLSEHERQAAVLCYLQGLSRAEAAQRLGLGLRRMQRLMEGKGARRPGVAAKVGALVESISEGRFCEEQASLMRAFAFGVLDPDGERYRVALAHRQMCPTCRAYVLSLRGLSAALPPVCLPALLGAGLSGASVSAASGGAPAGVASDGAAMGIASDGAPSGVASEGAPAGAASGGVTAGGPGTGLGLGALKLAVAGALLLGVGVGAVALVDEAPHRVARNGAAKAAPARLLAPSSTLRPHRRVRPERADVNNPRARRAAGGRGPSSGRSLASREFGIERGTFSGGSAPGKASTGGAPAAPGPRGEFGIE